MIVILWFYSFVSGCYHHHHFVLVIILITMSRVSLVCWYNGTLIVDMEGNPKYVNGVVKSVMANKPITLHELVEKIHWITKINSNEHQIYLTCKLATCIRAFYNRVNNRWWQDTVPIDAIDVAITNNLIIIRLSVTTNGYHHILLLGNYVLFFVFKLCN